MPIPRLFAALTLAACLLCAEPLGYFEQKFTSINFAKGKWDRSEKMPCFTYASKENGALVEVLRYGTANLVPFRATSKGLTVTLCGDIAAFDEGFTAGESR